eukprot:CAMPEP_0171187860 /NCGR_PEP_ID=MMETSP0790-20130122/17537_1 /TAXON_ID=2925 /ORGANISM="Alexandrium catenella, Strain OF101" /LENGTH=250 /DNA_ID=CAMNT_0011652931 /DNA_START=58 /DNA_END=810 /DNA_ORIENTATION=-
MIAPLILVAALLPVSAGEPPAGLPQAAFCSSGECEDASVSLLQASKEPLAPDASSKRRLTGGASSRGVNEASNATLSLAKVEEGGVEVELEDRNLTFVGMLAQRLEYEVDFSDERRIPSKNKVLLALIELLGLGMCGIDRCFLGQTTLGIIKGLTLGGLTLWAFLDYMAVIVTCLSMSPDLNAIGMRVYFAKHSVTPAFAIVLLLLLVFFFCGHRMWLLRITGSSSKEITVDRDDNNVLQPAAPVFSAST